MVALVICVCLFGSMSLIELIIIIMLLNKIETSKIETNKHNMEPNDEVTDFLASVCTKIPYFIDKKLMDEFDIVFDYKGMEYHLLLTRKAIVKKSVWKRWKELFECSSIN